MNEEYEIDIYKYSMNIHAGLGVHTIANTHFNVFCLHVFNGFLKIEYFANRNNSTVGSIYQGVNIWCLPFSSTWKYVAIKFHHLSKG